MTIALTDGRGELYQWDTGRTLTVDDATVTQVHFQNRAYGRTIDVDVNDGAAIIPDEILQKPGELRVYAFSGTAESGFTKVERVFNIVRRNKPNDYMFTPTEQKSLEGLQKQIGDLSDLKTDAKTDIVTAINETATAGQTLGLTGAIVGQVPVVKTVDENGAPTEWEAVELPSGAYIVNLTMDYRGNITADKTFAEIKAAYDDGKVVDAKFAGMIVPLSLLSDSKAIFTLTNANSHGIITYSLTCTSDNVWSASEDGFAAHSLGLTGATVGQTVKIKAVDKNGIPTEWEAADAAEGVGAKLIIDYTTVEETLNETIGQLGFTTSLNGDPLSLKNVLISIIGTVVNETDADSLIRVDFGGGFIECYCKPLNAPSSIYVLASVGNGVIGIQYPDNIHKYTMGKTIQHQGEAITKINIFGNNFHKTHLAAGANIKVWGW